MEAPLAQNGGMVPHFHQKLLVRLMQARGLINKDFLGKLDPYAVAEFQKQKKKTTSIKGSTDPMWNAQFEFDVDLEGDPTLNITVWDKETIFKDDFLGGVNISVKDFLKDEASHDNWYALEKRHKKTKVSGDVHCSVRLIREQCAREHGHSPAAPVRTVEGDWVIVDARLPSPPPVAAAARPTSPPREPLASPVVPAAAASGAASPQSNTLGDQLKAMAEAERRQREEEQDRLFKEFLAREFCCVLCSQGQHPDSTVQPSCGHILCHACVLPHARSWAAKVRDQSERIPCPVAACQAALTEGVMKRILPPAEFDTYINKGLESLMGGEASAFFKCPKCSVLMERISSPAANRGIRQSSSNNNASELKGPDNKPLSAEALQHRDEFRFRCRSAECMTEFCAGCMKVPYHLGFTCQQYQRYLVSRHCRFCASPMAAVNPLLPPSLAEICDEEECQKKREMVCPKIHRCKHFCGGVRGEAEDAHLPCLEDECRVECVTQSRSDFCNICWVEEIGAAPSVLLSCAHVFHYACVLKKLKERWPHARITFGFMNCPLCKKRIDHPALKSELAPCVALYDDIKAKALQRLEFEGLKKDPEVSAPTGKYYNRPADYAMDRFAYYPCYQCKRPYFGGQRRCDAGEQNRPFDPKDLICGSCAGGSLAATCAKHGKDYIEHKCQYCCNVATWFCWGKVHFCDDCHTRQQKGDYVSRKPKNELPVCPGPDKCPLKRRHPPNGEPFTLGCILCANLQTF